MNTLVAALPWMIGAALICAFVYVGSARRRRHRDRRSTPTLGSPLVLTPRFSPVGPDFQGSDEHWIELAAEVCCQHNHRLGVIALQVVDPDTQRAPMGDKLAAFNDALAPAFGRSLRASDLISIRDRGEVVIGVPFVLNKDQIERIIERLRPIARGVADAVGLKARCDFGLSMYPSDGDAGGELIQSALHDAERGKGARRQLPPRPVGDAKTLIDAAR